MGPSITTIDQQSECLSEHTHTHTLIHTERNTHISANPFTPITFNTVVYIKATQTFTDVEMQDFTFYTHTERHTHTSSVNGRLIYL